MQKLSSRLVWIAVIGLTTIGAGWTARRALLERRQVGAAQADTSAAKREFAVLASQVRSRPRDPQAHKALADFLAAHGMMARAAVELNAVLRLDPGNDSARKQLADTFYGARKLDAAEAVYHDLTVRRPRMLAAWQGLAATLVKEKRFLEAMHVLRPAYELNPNSADTHLLMAKAALEYAVQFPTPLNHGWELDFARREFERLARTMPDNGEIQYQLGRAYTALHDKPHGLAALQRAHALLPSNLEIGQMLVLVLRAMDDEASALKVTRDLLAIDPEATPTNDLYGQIILRTREPGKEQQAVEAFRKAVKHEPNNVGFLQHLADALILTGDLKGAQSALEHAVKVDPNVGYSYQRLALVYTRTGDRERAAAAARAGHNMETNENQLRRLEEITAKHPENVDLHLVLAKRYETLKRLGPARDEYLVVLKLDPGNKGVPKALASAADAYGRMRQ